MLVLPFPCLCITMRSAALVLLVAGAWVAHALAPPHVRPPAIRTPRLALPFAKLDLRDSPTVPAELSESTKLSEPPTMVAPWLASGLPVLALCCIIAAICSLDRVVMSVAILPMGEQYGYSDSTRGLIASAFSFGYFLGLGPAGLASSSTSPKAVLGAGLVIWSLAQAVTPAVAEVGMAPLLFARAMMGIGEAAAIPSLQVIAANFVPASSRSKFWGVLTACLSLGTITAYSFTPPIVTNLGWPSAFEIFGVVGLFVALFWALLGADLPMTTAGASTGIRKPSELAAATGKPEGTEVDMENEEVPWGEMASSRPVWALCAAHASSNFFLYFALSWLPTYFACVFPPPPFHATRPH